MAGAHDRVVRRLRNAFSDAQMTPSRSFALIAVLLSLLIAWPSIAADPSAQKNSANGVTVSVTPQLGDAATWSFKVVLDTHSQDLSDDLLKTTTLIGPDGKRYSPGAWDGAGPGGHHRESVLRFMALTPRPASIDLEMRRPSESALRVFTWQLQP